jgi:hypothetical protein
MSLSLVRWRPFEPGREIDIQSMHAVRVGERQQLDVVYFGPGVVIAAAKHWGRVSRWSVEVEEACPSWASILASGESVI